MFRFSTRSGIWGGGWPILSHPCEKRKDGPPPRLRSKSKVKVEVKGDGQECPSDMGKIKIPVPVSDNAGRDKDGTPDKTNH